MSRAARDAAAAAEIRFGNTYSTRRASGKFARRNADRVTSLGAFEAPNIAAVRKYSQLRDLKLKLDPERESVTLLPCSLTKLVLSLRTWSIDWDNFRPLCCLQELKIYNHAPSNTNLSGFRVQLDDRFATALPLLRVFDVAPGAYNRPNTALETTAEVVMPHLVELAIRRVNLVHLDLHFMSALNSLRLHDCTASTVSAACSTIILSNCWMREGTLLVNPNLRSLSIYGGQIGGGLHKLDVSMCRHALSILCTNNSSIEFIGAKPSVDNIRGI